MDDEQNEEFRRRLKKIIGIKFNTTMMCPIAQFEMAFGHLWGHGKNIDELNADEAMYREKWEAVRKITLDNGNSQKRNAWSEIDMHDVSLRQYHMTFKMKENV